MPGAAVTSKLNSSSSMMICGRLAVASQARAAGSAGRPAACASRARLSGPFAGGSASIHPVEASRDTATTPERARLEI